MGLVYDTLGQYDQALACYEESLSITKEVVGERHIDVGESQCVRWHD